MELNERDLIRGLLVDTLVSASMRYGMLAARAGNTGLRSLLEHLSTERAAHAGWVLAGAENEAARVEWEENPNPHDLEVVEQAVAMAIADGASAMTLCAMEGESAVAEVIEDLPPDVLSEDLLARLEQAGEDARRRLRAEILTLRASADVMEFRTKGAGRRDAPAVGRVYEVWFGTNRQPIRKDNAIIGFSGERDNIVHVGRCGVSIPHTHRFASDGSPWWYRTLFGDDRLRVADIKTLGIDAFWAAIREAIAKLNTKTGDAIVFLHGYRVSFEAAAIQAAQIGADLKLPAPMAFFSWPSKGRLLGYPADETSIEFSEDQITAFLTDFTEHSGARRVHLIAHSMGNRGLLHAVGRIAEAVEGRTGKAFGQIILAAPDVDTGVFRKGSSAYAKVAERTTLYVSRGDLAVRLSKFIHSASRIGFAPPVTVVPDIDTVNVTNADVTLLGHGYVGSSRLVLIDMHQLLTAGTPPGQRATLEEKQLGEDTYWEIPA